MSIRLVRDVSIEEAAIYLRQMMQEGKLDPSVRRLSEEAVLGHKDQVRAVYEWVQEHLPYAFDPETAELFIHPRRIAEDYYQGRIRMGDCDDAALLAASMLGSLGHQTRLSLIATGDTPEIDHAVAQVFSPELDSWLMVDPTAGYLPMGWIEKSQRTIIID